MLSKAESFIRRKLQERPALILLSIIPLFYLHFPAGYLLGMGILFFTIGFQESEWLMFFSGLFFSLIGIAIFILAFVGFRKLYHHCRSKNWFRPNH